MIKRLIPALLFILITLPAFAAFLEVTWNANPETDLAGYRVYYKASTASTWTVLDAGNVLKVDIPNMSENLEYCAQVSAYDTSGNESAKAAAVCDILDTVPPSTPTGIKAKILKLLSWLKGFFG